MRRVLVVAIRWYQRRLSPWLGARCRFEPSCSEYACQALERYGTIRGVRLTLARLWRCRPGYPEGPDPVPGLED